ncbi:MAG: hypothetical protein RRC34_01610 [Lentisphaeria bacterium]|nr:hypothetical protein [Lentisphaeria bacterium]
MLFLRHFLVGMLLAAGVCFLTGCLSDDAGDGDLPWSEPAGWENTGFGIPM